MMKPLRVGEDINICNSRDTALNEAARLRWSRLLENVINTGLWDRVDRTMLDFMAEL